MPFHQPDGIRYFTFESLVAPGLLHATLTRRGGASPEPWASLNLGATVGDEAGRVSENRRRALAILGLSEAQVYEVWQVHSREVVCAHAPRPAYAPRLQADAIVTDRPGMALMMRFADCTPIFLYDPRRKVIGIAHAGWQGTVKRIAAHTVQVMQARYGSKPEDILAGIGPSIGAHHYQVGEDVIQRVEETFGPDSKYFLRPHLRDGIHFGVQFDLWQANRQVLEQAGVKHIEISQVCTACHLDDWYSHRAESGRTGRFGALMALLG